MSHAKPSVAFEQTLAAARAKHGVEGKDVVLGEVDAAALVLHVVRNHALFKGVVAVAVHDVSFPGVVRSMELHAVAEAIVVAADLALVGATVANHRAGAVSLVRPVELLAITNERQVRVRGVALRERAAVWTRLLA